MIISDIFLYKPRETKNEIKNMNRKIFSETLFNYQNQNKCNTKGNSIIVKTVNNI